MGYVKCVCVTLFYKGNAHGNNNKPMNYAGVI